jgi:ATP-dependent DNA ligase
LNRTGLDGELCGVFPNGTASFGMIQTASDARNAAGLAYFIFDLLHLDGDDIGAMPLIERKTRLTELLSDQSLAGIRLSLLVGRCRHRFGQIRTAWGSGSVRRRVSSRRGTEDRAHSAATQDLAV